MAKHHILAVFAASILSRYLFAATPVLGPEVPLVSGVAMRSAAYNQTAPTAASNGNDYLVAWVDGRRLSADIYVSRVQTDGQPAESLGRRIGAGTNPKIASAGGDYVLVWQTSSGIQSLRLSADGAPLSLPHAVGSGEPVALVSNGSTYLLVTRPAPGAAQSSATVLDRDGAPLRSVPGKFASTVGAAAYGGRYYLIDAGASITLRSITQDGEVTDRVLPVLAPIDVQASAAFAPGAVLVAWSSGRYILAGYDGSVLQNLTLPIANEPLRAVAAGWDGSEFLAVISRGGGANNATIAFRIAFDGTLQTAPLTLPKPMFATTFAAGGAGQLIVWSEYREFTLDIVALATQRFSALDAELTSTNLISFSGEAEGDIQIARGPRGILTVWDDADRWLRVSASFNGGPAVTLQSTPGPDYVGWPAVAAGENVFLVVWRHAALSGGPHRLLGKRFDFDGNDLDPQPLVVSSEGVSDVTELQNYPQTPSIAFDGSAFIVAWIERQDLYTIRVPESGSALHESETALSDSGPTSARSPRALWIGAELLVGFTLEIAPVSIGAQSWSILGAVRFDRFGTPLGQVPRPPILSLVESGVIRISAALAPDAVVFAWVGTRTDRQDITVVQTTLGGQAKSNPVVAVPRVTFGAGPSSVEIGWTGSEYVLAWVERAGNVKALRLDAGLRPIDSEPFEVSAGPAPQLRPWLITVPSGVLIAYSRPDAANDDAPRVFMRALARNVIARTRAVGR